MPPDPIISVRGLGKKYVLGETLRHDTFRDHLAGLVHGLLRRGAAPDASPREEEFWALKDVSFDVQEGEVLGIIGRNGAGKSTLLKVLSRITEPTTGEIRTRGRISSLLEVGTGFHPELTGRENVFLNGAILGMRQAEIKAKFDEIVAFSGVERFLDTPVKRYSSGMYVRLAFAVAAHLDPEILIVDEVLAVGDAEFQKKCLGKMHDAANQGRTVLFVSHNMFAVKNLCTRAIVLSEGALRDDGAPEHLITSYLADSKIPPNEEHLLIRGSGSGLPSIREVWLEKGTTKTLSVLFGDRTSVYMRVASDGVAGFCVELLLRAADGTAIAFAPSGLASGWEISAPSGESLIRVDLPPLKLAQGDYTIDAMLAKTGVGFLDYRTSALRIHVASSGIGPHNWSFKQERGQGYLVWGARFSLLAADGSVVSRSETCG
jgi:lipopolysaccharide transport system ATP-binding protein